MWSYVYVCFSGGQQGGREAGRQGGREAGRRGSSAKLNSLLSSDSDGEMVKRSPNGVAIDFIHISVVEPIQGKGL